MALLDLLATAPTWALGIAADGNPVVGPLAAFATTPPDLTVTVIAPEDVPAGAPGETVHIRENAQEFDVTYYAYTGMRAASSTIGGATGSSGPTTCATFS